MFPLGNPLMPGARLPLHVFEARYRALVEHSMATSAEFGVVLIERGSEVGGGDVRFDVGTLARIEEVGRFPDGRYALSVIGTQRLRVESWRGDDPFPQAVVTVLDEPAARPGDAARREALVAAMGRVAGLAASLGIAFDPAMPEGLIDAIWYAAAHAVSGPLDAHRVLAADDLDVRFANLLDALEGTEVLLRHRLDEGR